MSSKYVSLYSLAEWKNGLAFKQIHFAEQGKPVIRIAELKNGITAQTAYTQQSFDESVHLTKGDMVFSWSGNPETSIDVFWYDLPDGWLNQHIFKVTANEDVHKLYLYYLLKSLKPKFTAIASNKQTTGLGHVTIKDMKELMIDLPDYDTQRAIGEYLYSIDQKAYINQQINDNLEQQIRSLFRVRFTDNPALEKMKQVPLSDLCQIVTKGTTPTTLGKPFVKSGINFIKAESILDSHAIDKSKFAFIDEETNTLLKRSVIKAGDIVFTIAGTLGRFALIDKNVLPANTNQAVAIIRADVEKVLPEYIYTCFIGEWHNHYYTKRVQQAVQANLSLTTIKSLPIPLLDESEMVNFTKLIIPLIKMIKQNEVQNETLTLMRDTLLPKLMSGEIDVSAVQL